MMRVKDSRGSARRRIEMAVRALSAVTIVALGVIATSETARAAAQCENPDALTFAMVPTEETVAELELYKPVTDRMAKLTGKKIQFFMPTSYASVVEGLLGGFVDVAVLGPYSYVIASSKDSEIEVFATYAKRAGHLQEEGPGYKGTRLFLTKVKEEQDSELLYSIRSKRYKSEKEEGRPRFLVFFKVDKVLPLVGAGRDPDKYE